MQIDVPIVLDTAHIPRQGSEDHDHRTQPDELSGSPTSEGWAAQGLLTIAGFMGVALIRLSGHAEIPTDLGDWQPLAEGSDNKDDSHLVPVIPTFKHVQVRSQRQRARSRDRVT